MKNIIIIQIQVHIEMEAKGAPNILIHGVKTREKLGKNSWKKMEKTEHPLENILDTHD